MPPADPFDVEIHEMELCTVLKAQEESYSETKKNAAETSMADAQPEDEEEEEEEVEEKETKTQDSRCITIEEQSENSEAIEEKTET